MELPPAPYWRDGDVELFMLTPELVTDDYVSWLNDPEVGRFLESRFAVHDKDATIAFVRSHLDNPDSLLLGIRCHSLGRHIGNIKLGPINRMHGLAEVGIMIGAKSAWGRGIASRAIAIICAIARDQLGLRKLSAGCYVSNQGSERAFVRSGFAVEGCRPQHLVLDNRPEDLILMGKLL